MDHDSWRKAISDDFDSLKLRAIISAAVGIYDLTLEEVLAKFDAGQNEHNDDVSGLSRIEEQREELIDHVAYEALE